MVLEFKLDYNLIVKQPEGVDYAIHTLRANKCNIPTFIKLSLKKAVEEEVVAEKALQGRLLLLPLRFK